MGLKWLFFSASPLLLGYGTHAIGIRWLLNLKIEVIVTFMLVSCSSKWRPLLATFLCFLIYLNNNSSITCWLHQWAFWLWLMTNLSRWIICCFRVFLLTTSPRIWKTRDWYKMVTKFKNWGHSHFHVNQLFIQVEGTSNNFLVFFDLFKQ